MTKYHISGIFPSSDSSAREIAAKVQPRLYDESRTSRFLEGGDILEIETTASMWQVGGLGKGAVTSNYYAREGTAAAQGYWERQPKLPTAQELQQRLLDEGFVPPSIEEFRAKLRASNE